MTADVLWKPLSIDMTGPPPAEVDRTGFVALVPVGDRAWGAGAAVTLARSLARGGRRVYLCDLDLEAPRLHDMVGAERGVGVSDYALYGASSSHVSTEVEDGLMFVSAGTPVAGLAPVFESARWKAFIESVADAAGLLLLFVPPRQEGAAALLDRAGSRVALGDPAGVPQVDRLLEGVRLGFQPTSAFVATIASLAPDVTDEATEARVAEPAAPDEVVALESLAPDVDVVSLESLAPDEVEGVPGDIVGEPGPDVVVAPGLDIADAIPLEALAPDPVSDDAFEHVMSDEAALADPIEPEVGADASIDLGWAEAVEGEEQPVENAPLMHDGPVATDDESAARDDVVSPDRPKEYDDASLAGVPEAATSTASPSGGRRGGTLVRVAMLLLAVVAVAVGAGRMGWVDVPGIASRRGDAAESPPQQVAEPETATPDQTVAAAPVEDAAAPEAAPAVNDPPPATVISSAPVTATHQIWSLRIGAFASQAVARREAAAIADRVQDHVVVIAPVDVAGRRWWRVISSLAPDRESAEGLRTELGAALVDVQPEEWLVRQAPSAFLLDETAAVDGARASAADWRARGIDAYVMAVAREDGTRSFRVYAGAYASSEEAAAMRELLVAAGVESPTLVERRGIRPE
ncbi:MAG: hypothetical protein HKO98_14345 [Gemmatimonadetes bacterium]|nr:hypothetical protein [Gemmatimonadota bacterium]